MVAVHSVFLSVEQSYPQLERSPNEPIEQAARGLLAHMGISTTAGQSGCDAELTIALVGKATSETYSAPDGSGSQECYNGGFFEGQMTLTAQGVQPLTVDAKGYHSPLMIFTCYETPSPKAEFKPAWAEALVEGFERLWGTPALLLALSHDDSQIQEAAAEAVSERRDLGPEAVSYLAEALSIRHGRMRESIATALANMGQDAWEAIPALIQAWESLGETPMPHEWGMFNFALIRITLGAPSRPSCDGDLSCWKEWWGAGRVAP